MVVATCVFEGSTEEVETQRNKLSRLAEHFRGIGAGEENGRYVSGVGVERSVGT